MGVMIASAEAPRSEEHTSELQSRSDLVCRLLLEKRISHRPSASWGRRSPSDGRATGRSSARPVPLVSSHIPVGVEFKRLVGFIRRGFFLKDAGPPELDPFPLLGALQN